MGNLSNLYVSRSFQSLIHLATDNTASANLIGLEDGYGNPIGVSVNTTGDLSISGSFTASLQNGYVWVGNSSGKTTTAPTSSFGGGGSVPAGTISGSAQITALGFVSSSVTASSLITASAAGANITFTKGDASQFTITIATGSFVSASYAETASLAISAKDIVVDVKNTTGAQINKGTVVRIIGATGDNPLIGTASWEDDNNSANTLGFVVANIPNDSFGRVMTQGTLLAVDTDPALGYAAGDLVYLSGSGQYTRVKPPAPYHEVRLGQVLRAQQNNGSIYVLIQNGYELTELHDVDINTGSLANKDILAYDSASGQWENWSISGLGLATTGSNTFIGNQVVSGYVSASNGFRVGGSATALEIGDGSNIRFLTGSSNYYNIQLVPDVGDIAFSRDGASNTKTFTLAGSSGASTTFQNNPVQFQSSVGGVTFSTPISVNSGINTNVDITGSLKISSTFDAPLTQGYVWVGDASGRTTTVATSSFSGGGGADLTSLNAFTASQFVSNSYFATTGSNNFIGVETINDVVGTGQGEVYLLARSGSLVLSNSTVTPTYAGLSFISSSQINANTNLIFKTNTNAQSTIVSGSANLFVPNSAPSATFTRYIGGSGNIMLSATAIPQITSSYAFSPTFTNNYFGGSGGLFMRTPLSSSAYTITNNAFIGTGNVSFGTAAAPFVSASAGFNMSGVYNNGTITLAAYKTTLSSSMNLSNNFIGGALTVNADSSSVSVAGSTIQGVLTINNSYFNSGATANTLSFQRNAVFGVNHNIYASGSNTATTVARIADGNLIAGIALSASLNLNGDLSHLQGTGIIGHGLSVTGSSARYSTSVSQSIGSVFVGRFNDQLGNKAKSAETIFAVGTGTPSVSKTGFLIDSGSNTFVEGTLNVSGASSLNGNLTITGSLTASLQQGYVWVGDASGLTTTVATSSFGGGGGGAAFPYTGSAQITGSLGVTGSISGLVNPLTISSNTASMDFNNGNFFTLQLVSGSITHLTATNIKAGQTINLLVKTDSGSAAASGSLTFSSAFKFAGGFDYTPTAITASQDLVSFVTFDTTQILAAQIKNLS